LPDESWKREAEYVLFSLGGFTDELKALARADGRVHLVDGDGLF